MLCDRCSLPAGAPHPDPQIKLSSALFTLQRAEGLRQTKAMHPSPAAPRQKRICSGETPQHPPAAPDHAFPQPLPPGTCLCRALP